MRKAKNKEGGVALTGVCFFFSETGTEGGLWAFQDAKFISPPSLENSDERWSYEGLRVLKDGDFLTIYSKKKKKKILWEGKISLQWHPVFTESVNGLWIHADQKGIARKTWAKWFLKEFPAKLIPRRKPKRPPAAAGG